MTSIHAIHHIADDLGSASWHAHDLPVLAGTPKFSRNVQFTSDDGLLVAGIWESEPGVLELRSYPVIEYCKILSGELCIRDAAGGLSNFGPGSAFVIPLGFTGQWEMQTRVRKEFVVRRPVPVATACVSATTRRSEPRRTRGKVSSYRKRSSRPDY